MKELSLADFLAEKELREMNNERRRKSMKKKKKEEQALRLMRMKDLVDDLNSIEDHIHYQQSSAARMKVKVIAVQHGLERLVKEQTPAPQRRRTSKKKRKKSLKINREEFLKK